MKVRKFEGATMRDALAKVKAELGDQAVILSKREVRRGLLGSAIEISAAIEDDDDTPGSGPVFGGPVPPRAPDADLEKLIAPLRSELRSLRALVRASSDGRGATELRSELAALRELVENLRPPPPSPRPAAAMQAPTTGGGALVAPSTGRRVLLVGPTGVGKTTTIAKLAARAALIQGRQVSLVTLDQYRVGGVEQIRAFAELIGVPLHSLDHPTELADAVVDETELTLIDTAGRSPRDTAAIAELAAQLDDMPSLEVHLVVPAATSGDALDDLITRYRPLRPMRLLFTKLDEVERAPELAIAPGRHKLPVTWVTTGQQVPEDIEEPTLARLVELASAGLHVPAAQPPAPAAKSTGLRGYRAA